MVHRSTPIRCDGVRSQPRQDGQLLVDGLFMTGVNISVVTAADSAIGRASSINVTSTDRQQSRQDLGDVLPPGLETTREQLQHLPCRSTTC
jgi:hypothetical protein